MWAKYAIHSNDRKKQHGFTIVELLIVIVIIGILASITIVGYNGIQQRAENQKTVSAVKNWVSILMSYKAVHGSFPAYDNSTDPYTQFPCLGTNYPGAICMSLNNVNTVGAGVAHESTDFDNKVKEISSSLPTPSFQQVIFSGEPMVGAFVNLGGKTVISIGYVLRGATTPCANIGGGTMVENARSSSGVYCSIQNIQ